mmetsp:Transcript_71619/g.155618  ORF Transcript_71619/g.155618 Transcript_71619/m.155618 type:complete len:209 (-) Transcript_71619:1613-2239(-)
MDQSMAAERHHLVWVRSFWLRRRKRPVISSQCCHERLTWRSARQPTLRPTQRRPCTRSTRSTRSMRRYRVFTSPSLATATSGPVNPPSFPRAGPALERSSNPSGWPLHSRQLSRVCGDRSRPPWMPLIRRIFRLLVRGSRAGTGDHGFGAGRRQANGAHAMLTFNKSPIRSMALGRKGGMIWPTKIRLRSSEKLLENALTCYIPTDTT